MKNKLNKTLSIFFCILFISSQLQSFAFNNNNSVIFSKTITTNSNSTPIHVLNPAEDFSMSIISNNENINYVNIENFTVELILDAGRQSNDYT